MKFIITKTSNKIELIKFFRKEIKDITLQNAKWHATNLPYTFEDLSELACRDLREATQDFADSIVETEPSDDYNKCYNRNINPPPEYIAAMAWYDTLSQIEKEHISNIVAHTSVVAIC